MQTPERIFSLMNAFQKSQALATAIKLDLFTAIASGAATAEKIANQIKASTKGTRILCDFLVAIELLQKINNDYHLTEESNLFLTKQSPAYVGCASEFLNSEMVTNCFLKLEEAVRTGGTAVDSTGTLGPNHPIWVKFARGMAPMMMPAAKEIAALLEYEYDRKFSVLDVAAGHGVFGIEIAKSFPHATIDALDWPNVLAVAKENAEKAGLTSVRYNLLEGNAFEVEFKKVYDVVLLTNFLHHFNYKTCVTFLSKVKRCLSPNGKVLTLEFVPNEDRVSPTIEAAFALVMLASTPEGDAYTFREYKEMFEAAGFSKTDSVTLKAAPQHVLISS